MEKQINLKEILNNQFEPNYDFKLHYGNTTTINILEAMKEACIQTLELAAENARITLLIDDENDIVEEANIDKQSILNTINQVI